MSRTVRDTFDIACPSCGLDTNLQVIIDTWARLSPDGTDPIGDHEWDQDSAIRCTACDHTGVVADFTAQPEPETPMDIHAIARRLYACLLETTDLIENQLVVTEPISKQAWREVFKPALAALRLAQRHSPDICKKEVTA